jgi:hypothetical protein
MTLKELKQKVLVLIEEYSPDGERLTNDSDIENKMNPVINQIMFEMCRIKKIPKYIEMAVTAGDIVDFAKLEEECGYDVYQIKHVSGVNCEPRAEGTVLKILESGTAEIDVFVYPDAITSKTKDTYEFELSAEVLEIMPYGIAADLLSTDISSNYKEFRDRYETMLTRLDPRIQMPSYSIVGGIDI